MNRTYRIIFNKNLEENIYKMRISGSFQGNPGQFYMLRSWSLDPFLSRPLSIYNIGNGYIEFLYEDRGKGTKLLSNLKEDDKIELLGPLGNGFKEINGNKIALVGGGIGIAPLFYLAESLKKQGKTIDFYAGFRSFVYELDNMERLANNVYISTDLGTYGYKGFIVDIIEYDKYDTIVTCGPQVMMEKIHNCHSNVIVSMEARMACGIGACLGCNIETKNGNKKVCKDGPVFLSKEVF